MEHLKNYKYTTFLLGLTGLYFAYVCVWSYWYDKLDGVLPDLLISHMMIFAAYFVLLVVSLYFAKFWMALAPLFIIFCIHGVLLFKSSYISTEDKFERGITNFTSMYVMICDWLYAVGFAIWAPILFFMSIKELKLAKAMSKGGADVNSAN